MTHEFLYDIFNKKILINFLIKNVIQKLKIKTFRTESVNCIILVCKIHKLFLAVYQYGPKSLSILDYSITIDKMYSAALPTPHIGRMYLVSLTVK